MDTFFQRYLENKWVKNYSRWLEFIEILVSIVEYVIKNHSLILCNFEPWYLTTFYFFKEM